MSVSDTLKGSSLNLSEEMGRNLVTLGD